MRAIILAAGFGSRLMPLTKDTPKCMVEFDGKKIIDYELFALKQAGISKIAVVGGYLANTLKTYVKDRITHFFINENYDKSNMLATLFCARDFLLSCIEDNEDLIVSYADIIYFQKSVEELMKSDENLSIVVDMSWKELWQKRFKDPLQDAETLKFKDGKIIELGKKPLNYDEIQAQYIGLFKLKSSFIKEVIKLYDGLDRKIIYDGKDFENMYMTSFLQILIDTFGGAKPIKIYGTWREIDLKSDLSLKF